MHKRSSEPEKRGADGPQTAGKRRVRLVCILLAALLLLSGGALLTAQVLVRSHTARVKAAFTGTLEELQTLFAEEPAFQALAQTAQALAGADKHSVSAQGTLTAAPHVLFGNAQRQWSLTLAGSRDSVEGCCAGGLMLDGTAANAVRFSFDEDVLLLGMEGTKVYSLTATELAENFGVQVPEGFGFAGASGAETAGAAEPGTRGTAPAAEREPPSAQALLQCLTQGGSGSLGGKKEVQTDAGVLRCDGYVLHWQPDAPANLLALAGQEAICALPLLPPLDTPADPSAVTSLVTACVQGTLPREQALLCLLARVLYDCEPTAELYLYGTQLRQIDLTRNQGGAVRIRLLGAQAGCTHVLVEDGDTVWELFYTPNTALQLRYTAAGQTQELLFYDLQSGTFRIALGADETLRQSGMLTAADGTLTLELQDGTLLLAPYALTLPLPQVEFLLFRAGFAPLELTLRVTRVQLSVCEQTPQMLSESYGPLLQMPLLEAAQVLTRLLSLFGSQP